MKKMILLVMVTLLCITSNLTGCGKSSIDSTDMNQAEYVISITTDSQLFSSSDQTSIGNLIKEKFGIVFNYNIYSGDMKLKQLLMLSSRDYDEIQALTQDDIVTSYVNSGALISLDKYREYLPDFYSRFESDIERWRMVGRGTLYKWENNIEGSFYDTMQNDICVQSDLLEKNNWVYPTNILEWQDFLKKYTYESNLGKSDDIVGMVMPLGDSYGIENIAASLAQKTGDYLIAGANTCLFNLKTLRYEDMLTNQRVKESYQFFNRLYQDGVLDKESLTDTKGSCIKKMKSGKALSSMLSGNELQRINHTLIKAGNENKQFCVLPIDSENEGINNYTLFTNSYYSFGVTNKCKEPKRVFSMLNWISSDEGQITLQNGIEDIHWEWKNKKRYPLPLLQKSYYNDFVNVTEGINAFRFLPISTIDAELDIMKSPENQKLYGYTQRQKLAYEKMGMDLNIENNSAIKNNVIDISMIQNIVIDPATSYGQFELAIKELIGKYVPQLICAHSDERFEEIYNQMLISYNKMKYSRVVDEYNRLLNMRISKE